MFIGTKPRMNKEAIFIEGDSCSKCYLMKPHAQKRAEANGYEFQVFRFDDTSVKEFDIQSVPMLILKEDGVVNQILDMDGIVALISNKYPMEEKEIIGCLGTGEDDTDYVLCDAGDVDILPNLYEKDEIRYEYNQGEEDWSEVSCTIFAAIGMLSDLINYEFSKAQIKEVDNLSYDNPKYPYIRKRGHGRYVKYAVDLVADRYNNSELSKKYGKVAYYRISKYNDKVIEGVIDKLYTIDGNHGLNSEYTKDKKDGMIDGTDFGNITNGHSVDVIKYKGQRSVKNSYKGNKNNIYGLKHELSEISNFGSFFYVYTLVSEDNYEEIKRLNEIKSECNVIIEHLQKLYHLVNDTNFQGILHYTADKLRAKIEICNEMLKKLS